MCNVNNNISVKRLSEIPFGEKCIYMSVGTHAGESIDEIVMRKNLEVQTLGWSMWSYSSPIAKKVPAFCESRDDIFVVMVDTGKPTKGEVKVATQYRQSDCDELFYIPDELKVTYAGNYSCALIVDAYYKIDESDNLFTKGEYEEAAFYNGFRLLRHTSVLTKKKVCKVAYVAKLKAPFSVYVK